MLSDAEIIALCKVQGWNIVMDPPEWDNGLLLIRDAQRNILGHSGGHKAHGRTPLQEAYKRAVKNFAEEVRIYR